MSDRYARTGDGSIQPFLVILSGQNQVGIHEWIGLNYAKLYNPNDIMIVRARPGNIEWSLDLVESAMKHQEVTILSISGMDGVMSRLIENLILAHADWAVEFRAFEYAGELEMPVPRTEKLGNLWIVPTNRQVSPVKTVNTLFKKNKPWRIW